MKPDRGPFKKKMVQTRDPREPQVPCYLWEGIHVGFCVTWEGNPFLASLYTHVRKQNTKNEKTQKKRKEGEQKKRLNKKRNKQGGKQNGSWRVQRIFLGTPRKQSPRICVSRVPRIPLLEEVHGGEDVLLQHAQAPTRLRMDGRRLAAALVSQRGQRAGWLVSCCLVVVVSSPVRRGGAPGSSGG